jgi:choline dehydrogenase-like flavoprotein
MTLPLDADRVVTSIEHFGQGDVFKTFHRERLARSANVRVVLDSTVTELVQSGSGSPLDHVEVRCLEGGHHFSVRARAYVLAIGALETARLMLLSDRATPGGVGNEHDLVGRYFMDHAWVPCGRLVPTDRALFNRLGMYDLRTVAGSTIRAKLVLSDDVKREARTAQRCHRVASEAPVRDLRFSPGAS